MYLAGSDRDSKTMAIFSAKERASEQLVGGNSSHQPCNQRIQWWFQQIFPLFGELRAVSCPDSESEKNPPKDQWNFPNFP